jgi:hypothetical protein
MSVIILSMVMLLSVAFSLLAVSFSAILFILISAAVGLSVWAIGRAKRGGESK